jgi:hypothetical protein
MLLRLYATVAIVEIQLFISALKRNISSTAQNARRLMMTRKERKKAKKARQQKASQQVATSKRINALAREMAKIISTMKPPYHDKRGDTFLDGIEGGCVPFAGKWGELVYCKDCWYNQPPKVPSTRPDVFWAGCHKRGTWKWKLVGDELVKP